MGAIIPRPIFSIIWSHPLLLRHATFTPKVAVFLMCPSLSSLKVGRYAYNLSLIKVCTKNSRIFRKPKLRGIFMKTIISRAKDFTVHYTYTNMVEKHFLISHSIRLKDANSSESINGNMHGVIGSFIPMPLFIGSYHNIMHVITDFHLLTIAPQCTSTMYCISPAL